MRASLTHISKARQTAVVVFLDNIDQRPPEFQDQAYENVALPIGHGQTISQPSVVGLMTQRLAVEVDFSNGNNTLVGRSQLWSATLRMLRDHPLFGAGLSGFTERLGPYWNANHIDRFIDPHNIVLNFWSETGLLGVVAFGWILITAFLLSWRGWRRSSADWQPIHFGVFLALVAVVIHGLIDVPYFKNDLSLEFWTLLGFTWAGTRWGMRTATGAPVRTPAMSGGRSMPS